MRKGIYRALNYRTVKAVYKGIKTRQILDFVLCGKNEIFKNVL